MGSLVKEYKKEKLIGQIYTPDFIVSKILDDVGYTNAININNRKLLDPACGDGQFLKEVVKRIIKYSPEDKLLNNLENIVGWDIDENAINLCIKSLNEIIDSLNIKVNWNIKRINSLLKYEIDDLFNFSNEKEKFDYIIGNPPYIRIQHLDEFTRNFIQMNYKFCKNGSTDIYIAFFELCINLLSENGICGLITPNTFFYTETARPLRSFFKENRNIIQLTNYGYIQLFENASTYSAITIFSNEQRNNFIFQKAKSKNDFTTRIIKFSELKEPFWQISDSITEIRNGKRLGDIANIHVGITTLCDKGYIFKIKEIDDKFILASTLFKGDIIIEKSILKPVIKGSTLKSSNDKISEWIIFPYKKINGKHVIIPEEELKYIYPLAYDYLKSIKDELDKRDNGTPNSVSWYAFGRSQGLDTSFGKKIIFSPMNIKPNFIYYENEECSLYSGYCIKYNGNIDLLLTQLNSERMQEFINNSSRDFRGGWKAYNKKVIENFIIEL